MQCKDCDKKSWIKLGSSQIQAHLKGEKEDGSDVIGIYPLFADGTCRFLAFDFDNHKAESDNLGFADDDISWVDEEMPEYYTPTGRVKKRKSHIGLIHGAKDTSNGIIDIAMVGSLKKKGEFHEHLKLYGMVIVDEYHHSASDTMSEVLMEVNARSVYGVTATPFRGDGLEKINNMLLGPIRFQYTSKEKAEAQGINHVVIPRFTRVVNFHGRDKMHVNDAYEIIRKSRIRNNQIYDDIRKCIAEGRTPVVLSRYKEHAELIYKAVREDADKVFLLTGSLSKKQQRDIRLEMNKVGDDESMILIATGQLVGGCSSCRMCICIYYTSAIYSGISIVQFYVRKLPDCDYGL